MERSACRSLRVHRRHTPNDRDSISRLFTPIRRSMGVLRRRPTCNASSPSPRRAFTKCYSSWSVTDSFAALRDAPELSKCSSLPKTFQCCDERQNSIDHNLCAEVLAPGRRLGDGGAQSGRVPVALHANHHRDGVHDDDDPHEREHIVPQSSSALVTKQLTKVVP